MARDGDRRPAQSRARRPGVRRDGAHATRYGDLVLVATRDSATRRVLCDRLDKQGYRALVADASTRVDELATLTRPLVIVLDLDGENKRGLGALARIREHSATPVIVLATRSSEGDKVTALDAGADDYVVKPFGPKELLARIRVAARYARSLPPTAETYDVGPIRIDTASYKVTVNSNPVHLTPIEFRLLLLLARHRGAIVTREQIFREIWGSEVDQAQLLRTHLATLRKKIEADPAHPQWLITVVNVGYRLGG